MRNCLNGRRIREIELSVQKVQIVQGIKIDRLEPVAFRLFFTDERAALAAAFFNETDLADRHLAVDGFAHDRRNSFQRK